MVRALVFFIKLALLVALAVWLAEQPGQVSITWLGYRLDTSVGVLLAAALLLGVVLALVYRFWRGLLRAPGRVRRQMRNNRRERGYRALTRGLVAVASGDREGARRWSKRADLLLEEPPLTLLLSAQAAQLDGNRNSARRDYTRMLEREETRFLGLRGLMLQAEEEGDGAGALKYLIQARDLKPETPWVQTALFSRAIRQGDLALALQSLEDQKRYKLTARNDINRARGLVLTERARRQAAAGDGKAALDSAKEAFRLVPNLPAAGAIYARQLAEAGKVSRALDALDLAWRSHPHPAIAELYLELRNVERPIERLKALQALTKTTRDHPESRLILGRAALEAELWGEARRHLLAAAGDTPGESVCRLMAELEEAEHHDSAAARQWLLRAAEGPGDPAWVCGTCGTLADDWFAICGNCGSFDSFSWKQPPRATMSTEPLVLAAAERGRALQAPSRRQAEENGEEVEDAETVDSESGKQVQPGQ